MCHACKDQGEKLSTPNTTKENAGALWLKEIPPE